jgi:hypothetical protein
VAAEDAAAAGFLISIVGFRVVVSCGGGGYGVVVWRRRQEDAAAAARFSCRRQLEGNEQSL